MSTDAKFGLAIAIAAIGVIIGVIGVVVAVGAKDGNRSNEELAKAVGTQLSEQRKSSSDFEKQATAGMDAIDRRQTRAIGRVRRSLGATRQKVRNLGRMIRAQSRKSASVRNDLNENVTAINSRIRALGTQADKQQSQINRIKRQAARGGDRAGGATP